jgi:hypothetical protein
MTAYLEPATARLELGLRLQRLIQTGERSGLQTHIATTVKRFVVRADEKLTAFLQLESASRVCGELV